MKVTVDYEDAFLEINEMIRNIPDKLQAGERPLLRKIGKSIKGNVERNLSYSDVEEKARKIQPSNYDGSIPYVHMRDDVKAEVKKSKDGDLYVIVKGGKMTGYKWNFLNNGTVHIRATNFMDKAMIDSEKEVESQIDEFLKRSI